MSVFVVAEYQNGSLKAATANTVAAAHKLGKEITVLVAGDGVEAIAKEAASLNGVSAVWHVEGAHYAHALAEEWAPLIAHYGAGFSHVLMPASTFGKNILPRAAALMDVQAVSDVVALLDEETFVRPTYAGNAMATVRCTEKVKCLSIRPTAFPAVEKDGNAAIEVKEATPAMHLSRFENHALTDPSKPQLGTARVVVSGGRGLKAGENFKLLEDLAAKLGGGAVGASRAAVDIGWVPNDYQVGQTGKVVAPDLYVAVGISGAIQHLAGMKDSKVIVAINKDENAPIFEVATYGLVGDLFDVIPQMIEELSK